MRVRIHHETAYAYDAPASRSIQVLRLTPRGHDGQFVVRWRIEIDRDCRLDTATDPFGNTVHSFTVEGPLETLSVTAEGEVETQDTNGVIKGQVERLPPPVFLRDTALTQTDEAIRDLAAAVEVAGGSNRIAILHGLMGGIGERMKFEPDTTNTGTSAIEAFAAGRGVCQDFAHVFIAASRFLGIPARYVSGYLLQRDGDGGKDVGHAWAEALVPGLGWVGFDPANGVSPTENHVRVAVGLDYLGAAPIRGTRYGGGAETMLVRLSVEDAGDVG